MNLQQDYELRLFFLCKGKLDLHCVLGVRKFCMSSEVMKGELPPSKEYKRNDVAQGDLSYFFFQAKQLLHAFPLDTRVKDGCE